MKLIKRLLIGIILIVLLAVFGFWLYTFNFHPDYDGTLELDNLSAEVTVHFDDYGVPHIKAQNQKDAYTALGYVHAQDRLWQMELIRRIAPGRLSEVFGVNEKVQQTDLFFSGLGIEENADESIAKLDKNSDSYRYAMAYIDGVNQFIENGFTPIEYTLVGLEKEKFTLKDMYNVFGYMSFSFAIAHKTDPLLTEIKEKLGDNYLAELGIPIEASTATLKSQKNPMIEATFARVMNDLYESLPISPFIGSNSWVIGPQKTKSGKVLFANDPHISFAQPSVWYQAHIKTPNYEMYGYNLALTPFPLLGHNKDYAYGLTMFENDDVDFFFEQNNPDNDMEYTTPEGYKTYEIRNKTLKVKDRPDSTYQVRVSKHGPIMNDLIAHVDDNRPMAMWWAYTQLPNKILDVAYSMSHAKSLAEFQKGAALLHAPGLNIMYGDSSNNIAWFASGHLYKYKKGTNTKLVLNGASGEDEIVEMLPFEANPQAINPDWNYVYSANNQPDSIAGMLYPGYYLPEDRGKRIAALLEAKNDWTKEEVTEMIFDVKSSTAQSIVANLTAGLETTDFSQTEQKALEALNLWDGFYKKQSNGPTIYTRLLYEFLSATYKDEMGKGFEVFLNTPLQKKILAVQAARENSVWWDNIETDAKETREDILQKAFTNTVAFLENQLGSNVEDWIWSRVASVEHKHAVGEVPSLRSTFNVGPFAMDGGNEVINNQLYNLNSSGYYWVHAGPSTRRVIDFSDVESSVSILPTGQSGNVFSPHYKDQAEKYVNGEFVPMLLNQEAIEKSKNKLMFRPNIK